jgi:hypothetical protein
MLLKLYARWARWEELMQLDKSWLDYSNDGVMLSAGAEQYGDGVWHYTRALALASAASHESDGGCAQQLLLVRIPPGSLQSHGVQQPITQPAGLELSLGGQLSCMSNRQLTGGISPASAQLQITRTAHNSHLTHAAASWLLVPANFNLLLLLAAAARASLQQQMRDELAGLDAAVAATPVDPLTKPGDGIGIYSPGFKRLGQIEQLVRPAGGMMWHMMQQLVRGSVTILSSHCAHGQGQGEVALHSLAAACHATGWNVCCACHCQCNASVTAGSHSWPRRQDMSGRLPC